MTLKRISSKKLENVRRKPAVRKAAHRDHLLAYDCEGMNDIRTQCGEVLGLAILRIWAERLRVAQERLFDAAVPDEAAPRNHRTIYLHAREIHQYRRSVVRAEA